MLALAPQQLLDTAADLFYARGVTATGVDLVAAESGVAKTTMYAHFGSKDGLVAAYLRERGSEWRGSLRDEVARRSPDPGGRLLALFDVLAERLDAPGFRGCPFINAAAELFDREHPAWEAMTEHRTWMRGFAIELAEAAGARDATGLAASVLMLHDAAMVHGALDRTGGAAARRACESAATLLAAARA